jgi:hypothetical protein
MYYLPRFFLEPALRSQESPPKAPVVQKWVENGFISQLLTHLLTLYEISYSGKKKKEKNLSGL